VSHHHNPGIAAQIIMAKQQRQVFVPRQPTPLEAMAEMWKREAEKAESRKTLRPPQDVRD
jgi:hypothetical protein